MNISSNITRYSLFAILISCVQFLQAGIDCPDDKSEWCEDSIYDFDIMGEAVWDWEGVNGPITYVDDYTDFNDFCNEGTVIRTWTMEVTGESCVQVINMDIDEPFDGSTIIWPSDAQLSCWSEDYDDPYYYVPNPCEFVGINTDTDTIFDLGSSCALIQRHHTILNWCTSISYEHTQKVYILDEVKPELSITKQDYPVDATCHNDQIVLQATAYDTLGECNANLIYWTVLVDVWGDWTTDYEFSSFISPFDPNFGTPQNELYIAPTASGEMVNILLPESVEGSKYEHRVVFKASDGCANVTSDTEYFKVEDQKAPTPYCLKTISTTVASEIWARDFNLSSFDNCTDTSYLRYSFTDQEPFFDQDNYDEESKSTSLYITCEMYCDTVLQNLNVYTWDECGNVDHCAVQLNITSSASSWGCECGGTGNGTNTISGRIAAFNQDTLLGAQAIFYSEAPEYPLTISLDDQEFSIEDYNFINASIKFQKPDNPLNGVSTLDIVHIQRHILGLEDLPSKALETVADVDQSGNISSSDLLLLRQLILGIKDDFPHGEQWYFHSMDPSFYWQNDSLNTYSLGNLYENVGLPDMMAYKFGDVNLSAHLDNIQSDAETRNIQTIRVDNKYFNKGELVEIELKISDLAITGLQFSFTSQGEPLHFDLPYGFTGDSNCNENFSRISINKSVDLEASEFILVARCIAPIDGLVSDWLVLEDDFAQEIYDSELISHKTSLQFNSSPKVTSLSVFPNPFQDHFKVNLPNGLDSNGSLSILDLAGQRVDFFSFENADDLSKARLGSSLANGVYIYKIIIENNEWSGKMIKQ